LWPDYRHEAPPLSMRTGMPQTFGDSRTQGHLRERKPRDRAPLRTGGARDQSGTRPRHSRPVQDSAAATRRPRGAMVRACVQAWSAHPSTPRGGRQGRRQSNVGGGPLRWGRTGAQALTHGQAEHTEQVLQGQHGKAARHVENSGGGAQSGLMPTAQTVRSSNSVFKRGRRMSDMSARHASSSVTWIPMVAILAAVLRSPALVSCILN